LPTRTASTARSPARVALHPAEEGDEELGLGAVAGRRADSPIEMAVPAELDVPYPVEARRTIGCARREANGALVGVVVTAMSVESRKVRDSGS